jgi:hypothetical protein
MPTRRLFVAAALSGALIPILAQEAQAATYATLGSRTVNLLSDHDRIAVGLLGGLFTHIRLEVSGNAIFMQDLKVTFANGQTVDLPVRALIPQGGQTRDIQLPGAARAIRFIDMTYRRVPLGGTAVVTAVGRRP